MQMQVIKQNDGKNHTHASNMLRKTGANTQNGARNEVGMQNGARNKAGMQNGARNKTATQNGAKTSKKDTDAQNDAKIRKEEESNK